MKTISYIIKGLDCPHCASKVEKALLQNENIETVSIDLISKIIKISYKKSLLSIKELNQIISKAKEGAYIESSSDDNFKKPIIDDKMFFLIGRIILSALMVIVAIFILTPLTKDTRYGTLILTNYILLIAIYVIAYLLISFDVLWKFIRSLKNPKNLLNETTLMVIASISALALQHFFEGVLIIVFYQLGNLIEDISIEKSKKIITDTIDRRGEYAFRYDEHHQLVKVLSTSIKVDDILLIKTGEIIPVDGVVLSGEGNLDTSSLTGEFVLQQVNKDDDVYSGTILKSGTLEIKALSTFNSSTTSKILKMVTDSNERKTKAEKFITKFASWYTPIVMLIAMIVGVITPLILSFINGFTWPLWEQYILIGLTILVTACPCAIIISIPLAYFIGTARAFKEGVIVKGTNCLERLNDVNVVISDKTGTLTNGEFSIESITLNEIDQDTFVEYLYILESKSNHPIANAIIDAIEVKNIANTSENYAELTGFGVKCDYNNHHLLAGNEELLVKENIKFVAAKEEGTIVYLVVDNEFKGYVVLNDSIKESSIKTVNQLKSKNIKTILLTGGKEEDAKKVAVSLGIDEYHYELKPEEKLNYLKNEIHNNTKGKAVMFIGDGVNDSPCVALADVGVSMGIKGSDASVEESDIVLLNDDPYKIIEAKQIAKKTKNRCIFNIIFALIIKVAVMVLAILSLVDMWLAVVADTGLLIISIISSILLIKAKVKK